MLSSVISSNSSVSTSSLGRFSQAFSLLGAKEGSTEGNSDGSPSLGDADGRSMEIDEGLPLGASDTVTGLLEGVCDGSKDRGDPEGIFVVCGPEEG